MSALISGPDRNGWTPVTAGGMPGTTRDVLVWHGDDQMPLPAFYDDDEGSWFSKFDGCQFDDGIVTHWREIQAPEGVAN